MARILFLAHRVPFPPNKGDKIRAFHLEEKLSITRAWILVRYVESGMLGTTACGDCGGQFVTHSHEYGPGMKPFVCGLCEPPARTSCSYRLIAPT